MEKVKTGAFVPLPVVPTVLVGANVGGKPNYLAVGFVGGVNIRPPILGISLNRKHYTTKGILENGTFSVNVPSAEHLRETDYCGLVSGHSVDKSLVFSSFYGELKTAPMIDEFPIVCECRYTGQKVDFAMDTVFFGEVVQVYVNRDLYRKGKPADILRINPLLTGLDRQYRVAGEPLGRTFSVGWEYSSKTDTRQGNTDGNRCRIITRPPRNMLFIRCALGGAEGQGSIGNALAEIAAYSEKRGVVPTEGPFLIRSEDLEPEAGLRAGFVFASPLPGQGRIEKGRLAGGRFAECLHTGPYEKIGDAMIPLHSFIKENGFKGTGTVYEFYRNDPAVTPPKELETLIAMPVRRKR